MEVIKRMGLATLVVSLILLAFASIGGTKSAQAAGPFYGPYQPVCIQTAVVYNWQWQWNGYSWQWVAVPSTVCVRYARVNYPPFNYQYVPYQQYPAVFYTPINNCLQPLPGGGFYNGCGYNTVGYRYWWG